MEKILYFDYSAAVILVVLVASMWLRKMTKGRQNHYLLAVIGMSLVVVLADICAVQLDNMGMGNVLGKYISHTIYLLLHNWTTPIYILYLISLTDTWHKIRNSLILRIVLILPITIVNIALIVNLFVPIIFYLDEQDTYTRGLGFPLLYITTVLYLIFGIVYLCRYRKLLPPLRYLSLLLMFPMGIFSTVIQFFFPQYLVEMFVQSICLLLIVMVIQRPEERIDLETGLGSLNAYAEDMRRSFENEKPVKLILINIANYEALRDMIGYSGMKEMLYQVTGILTDLVKRHKIQTDMYYIGNGTFRLTFEERYFHELETYAEELNEYLKPNLKLKQMEVNLLACVCIVNCPEDISDVDSLFAFGKALNSETYVGEVLYADSLLRVGHYDVKRDIDRILENAISNHKFEVYYQPIYSVKAEQFQSAEALLRLRDETYGFISPEVFIPAAEKNGTIHKIGEYVLEEVCHFIASQEFKELGMEYIEVNLSVAQCMEQGLSRKIIEMLKKYQISTRSINLEITETAYSFSQNIMMENLKNLTKAGIRFSLDDYGTGYSNMQRIALMPFDLIKLDKSFTNVEGNTKMRIVLENTIQMIKNMGMETVVEGVETAEMVKTFSDLQCEYIQGYYYSKPLPKEEFVKFIKNANA